MDTNTFYNQIVATMLHAASNKKTSVEITIPNSNIDDFWNDLAEACKGGLKIQNLSFDDWDGNRQYTWAWTGDNFSDSESMKLVVVSGWNNKNDLNRILQYGKSICPHCRLSTLRSK